jgi:hypothetical protein
LAASIPKELLSEPNQADYEEYWDHAAHAAVSEWGLTIVLSGAHADV